MKNLKLLTTLCLFTLSSLVAVNSETTKTQANVKEVVNTSKESAVALKPFFTDGCTLFLEGPKDRPNLWRHCCIEHDLRYWFGGTKDNRDATDLRLKSCIDKVAGSNWARVIYYGVKTGHLSPIKNKTQWNWGWKEKRDYGPLTSDEVSAVKRQLSHMTVPEVDMAEFLKINFP